MHRLIIITIILILIIFDGAALAGEFIPGLVVNYSDFSYVSTVAVGFSYVYFGTTNGVIRYNFSKQEWAEPLTGIQGMKEVPIFDIAASLDDKNVWVRTDYGYFEYAEIIDRWEPVDGIPRDEYRGRHLLPDDNYYAPWGYNYMPNGAIADDRGRIFQLTDILDDNWTNLWIGTWGLGPAWADNTGRKIKLLNYGLIQEYISDIHLIDDEIWMAGPAENSLRTGISIYYPESNRFEYIETFGSLIGGAYGMNDLVSNEDEVFAATDNGIWAIDKKDREITELLSRSSGLPDDMILCLEIRGDTLFAGTEHGLGIMPINADTISALPGVILESRIILCLEMTEKALWIGTDRGAYRLNFKTKRLERLSAVEITQAGFIRDIKQGGDKIWISTDNELASINLKNGEIELFPEVGSYGGSGALAVRDTVVAVATPDGLLVIYDGQDTWHRLFSDDDGLISNSILDMIFFENHLWLATDRGLSRFWYSCPGLF